MSKALVVLVVVAAFIGIGLIFINNWAVKTFGVAYDPSNSRDLQKLLIIADNSRPLREALERYKLDHGNYPDDSTNLFPSYLHSTNGPNDFSDWAGWRYEPETTNTYSLIYKANWDDGLDCECSNNICHWDYFTSTRNTDLTQTLKDR
jgi:hypothetical protein